MHRFPLIAAPPSADSREVIFADLPMPTFPEVFKVENWELPITFSDEERLTPEVTVNDPPIPTLPVVVKVEELMSVADSA